MNMNENEPSKTTSTFLWAILILVMIGTIAATMVRRAYKQAATNAAISPAVGLNLSFPVPAYSFTNQHAQTITSDSLKGHPYIADFIFTSCAGLCPVMTTKMSQVQEKLGDAKVSLVSFTIDPEHDTIEKLKTYSDVYKAQPGRWHFLRGERDSVYDVLFGMKLAGDKNNLDIHSTKIALIDGDGKVRATYDTGAHADENTLNRLVADARQLAQLHTALPAGFPFPKVNASLNALSALLLLSAFIAIKLKKVKLHVSLIIAAVATSALFLTSYLTFHFAVKLHVVFPPSNPLRNLYFVILISHTILAVVILPLIFITIRRGYRKQWAAHKKIAVWTFPLWFYVSVTGVVIYFMLSSAGAYTAAGL